MPEFRMADREFNLLVAACRASYGEASVALGQTVNWRNFLGLARRHRVQALAWRGLGPARGEVPPDVAEQLAADSAVIVETNLRAAVECARLQAQFAKAGIELLFLKGLTVGALAYPDPFLKMGWDVDVLIEPDALHPSVSLLRSLGYLPAIPPSASDSRLQRWHRSRKESVWHHSASDIHLELHTRLADHPSLLPEVGTQSSRQLVKITDRIALPTLGKDELFAYLCVHGASSAWFRLKWITDLAALLYSENVDEIERLYRRSQQLGAGRAAGQALLLAHRLHATPIGGRLLKELESDAATGWLAGLACRALADPREPTEHFLGTAGIRLSQLPLLSGLRFPASEAIRQASEIMSARLGWD